MFFEHINLSSREHSAIADQHDPRQPEPLRERLDLVGDGLGVAGVAGINLHGDRSSVGVGQGAVDDDRAAGLAVAVVAEAGQRAGLPFEEHSRGRSGPAGRSSLRGAFQKSR